MVIVIDWSSFCISNRSLKISINNFCSWEVETSSMCQDWDKCKKCLRGIIYYCGCCGQWVYLLGFHFLNLSSAPFSWTKSKALWGIIAAYTNEGVAASRRLTGTLCHLYLNHKECFNKVLTDLTYKSYPNAKLQQAFHFTMCPSGCSSSSSAIKHIGVMRYGQH